MICIALAAVLWWLSLVITGFIRRLAILDNPNARSAHIIATPRGGGLAFVLCFLLSLPFLVYYELVLFHDAWVVGVGGSLVAFIGFLDDNKSLPALTRLIGHGLIALLVLCFFGGMPSIDVFSYQIPAGFIWNVVGFLYLVWMLNLYNFMDGINGIASLEAISVCFYVAMLAYGVGLQELMVLPLVLSFSVLGFLVWNFPIAKIFMGDVGSGFLGLVFGILSLEAAAVKMEFFWVYLILLGVFIVDATCTVFLRALHGENILKAHNTHAYQYAARHYNTHIPVTLAVLVINTVWLLPIAYFVVNLNISGAIGLVLAYTPLMVLMLTIQSGIILRKTTVS